MSDSYGTLQPPKRLLLGPGPSMVEARVYEALSKPIVGHLDSFFFTVTEDIRRLLGYVFGTENSFTVAISATGSGGMETAVTNFVEFGTKVAVLANGYFADRITEMARRHGAEVVRLEKPWGETFGDGETREFILREKPEIVAFVQAETSTGAYQEGKAISEAAHEIGALVIGDCVTSLGGMPVNVDENGIDIAYSGTQKALSCPPGLSPLTVSPRAMATLRARNRPARSWYFDLALLDEYYSGTHRYHHTAPISMFYALREALAAIHEEGLENRWARHRRNHEAFVAGIEAMGLRMHVAKPHRLWTLNTLCVPPGVDHIKVRNQLLEDYGIEIASGLGPLAGKVWRIGFMGSSSTESNVLTLLEALEEVLNAQGCRAAANGREAAERFYEGGATGKGYARAQQAM